MFPKIGEHFVKVIPYKGDFINEKFIRNCGHRFT